mgnify:CR=1 FL=1
MKKRENFVGKINAYLNTVLENIQVVTIILAAVMVTLDVLMRALFSKPISGTSEYVGYIMILASFFGLGSCTADRSHLKVDLVVQLLPEKHQVINVAGVGALMLYASINQGIITYGLKTKGTFSGVPNWPFYLLMGLGYLPVLLGAVSNFIEDIQTLAALRAEKK